MIMNILHNDVLYQILQHLYYTKDIMNIHLISKKFNKLLEANHIWKHYFDNKYSENILSDPSYRSIYHKYHKVSLLITRLRQ